MEHIFDRLIRFIMAVGMTLLGTNSLFLCAQASVPIKAVGLFLTAILAFGTAYWWMFDAKSLGEEGTPKKIHPYTGQDTFGCRLCGLKPEEHFLASKR